MKTKQKTQRYFINNMKSISKNFSNKKKTNFNII